MQVTRQLQEAAELFDGQTRVTYDPTHRKGPHRIVPGNGQEARAVGHDDVLALANDTKARFFERSYGSEVIHPQNPRHAAIERPPLRRPPRP